MGVHPKSLYKRKKTKRKKVLSAADQVILSEIKEVIKARSTYGYKRVTAMYNRQRREQGLEKYNKKRIYRIMKANGLLLPKSGKMRDSGDKTGRIVTLESNVRWCSDCFEICCFNGEKLYVSFVLDCCDREAISVVAEDRPLLGEDIQSLMVLAVEKRFRGYRTKREIEFLSDRGSIYRAYHVQALGRRLGLKSCFTRAYSPESNGMAESFVKTIKRDYVYVSDCYSAEKTRGLLWVWIEDYNSKAPHSGLGMMSPLEYRKGKEQKGVFEMCSVR